MAGLHEAEGVLDRVTHLAFALLAFAFRQVEREVHLVADVSRLQPVQRHAGHVGQQFGIVGDAGVARGGGCHRLEDGFFVGVVDR